MSKRHKAREIVMQGIYQYDIADQDLSHILKFDWINNRKKIPIDVFFFAEELIIGIIKELYNIDKCIIDNLYNWKFNNIFLVDKSILRLSVFTLLKKNDIPYIVIINEAINLAHRFGTDKSYKFINGVLNKISKNVIQNVKC